MFVSSGKGSVKCKHNIEGDRFPFSSKHGPLSHSTSLVRAWAVGSYLGIPLKIPLNL